MKVTIETNAMIKHGTCIGEVLVLLEILNGVNHAQVLDNLVKKGYITAATGQKFLTQKTYALTDKAKALLEDVNLDSLDSDKPKTRDIESLAVKLKEIFPKGKKPGTSQYWTEGVALIVKRLRIFFKKYGEDYTDEQVLSAAEKYVKSFNGDYSYMRTLKYFIWAEKPNKAGEVESTSDLLTFMENAGEESIGNDWKDMLI